MSSVKSVSNKSMSSKSVIDCKHYCKVCHDSGKPESEYRSHSTRETRDPNSRITCPVLLSIECRFCHKNGHTVKYCTVLKDKKKDEARALKKASSPSPKPAVEKVTNVYDCLLEEEVEEEQEFPEFSINTVISSNNSQLNYAAALAKPVVPMVRTASVVKKSWVQMSMESSDSEDDEDGSAW